jgi:hypothetical protein
VTYTLNFVIHLCFETVQWTWELNCINICLQKLKNWKTLTILEKSKTGSIEKLVLETWSVLSLPVSAVMWVYIVCKWWGRIRQKYDLYCIVIFTFVQLISHNYRFVLLILCKFCKLFLMEHCFCVVSSDWLVQVLYW